MAKRGRPKKVTTNTQVAQVEEKEYQQRDALVRVRVSPGVFLIEGKRIPPNGEFICTAERARQLGNRVRVLESLGDSQYATR